MDVAEALYEVFGISCTKQTLSVTCKQHTCMQQHSAGSVRQ